MLFGRYASNAREARFPQLWLGRQWAVCPSVQGPSGLRLYDLAGGRRHGTLTNMDAPTDWVRSQGRYALDFDGSNDYVGGFSNIQVTRGLTISMWFRATNTSKGRHSLYFNASNQGPDLYAHIEQVSGTTFAPNLYIKSYVGVGTSFTLDTEWHHYAWVVSADFLTVRYYRDGRSLGSVSNTTTLSQESLTGSIGGNLGLFGSGFTAQGQIDDVARYGRELSGGEIRLLATRRGIAYEMRRDIVFGQSGFKAYWAKQQTGLIGGGVR